MTTRRWAIGLLAAAVVAGGAATAPLTTTTAAPPPVDKASGDRTLGNGLGRLVAQSEGPALKRSAGLQSDQDALAIRDDQGRVLVQLTPQANADRAAFRRQAERAGLDVQSTDREHGTLEGFVPVSDVHALAALEKTGTLAQALRPITNAGAVTSQGVALQRVDKVLAKGVDGRGHHHRRTLGQLRQGDPDHLGRAADHPRRAGRRLGRPARPGATRANRQPVVVIEDGPAEEATDEGRGMLQITHDVAPGSKLCFATAFSGEVGFADNIRKLADRKGPCKADVVVDDVSYFSEPMFSDGLIGDAVDDVAAQGVHYFSSAGNQGYQQAWDSPVRLVPADRGVRNTNLDLSEVDPALYDGGLQDMNPGAAPTWPRTSSWARPAA